MNGFKVAARFLGTFNQISNSVNFYFFKTREEAEAKVEELKKIKKFHRAEISEF
jgi:hypothetical protein